MSTSALEPQRFLADLADVAAARPVLVESAGGDLRNAIRGPRGTCRVCAAPVNGFDRCWLCQHAHRIAGVAGGVAPLTSAVAGTPSARVRFGQPAPASPDTPGGAATGCLHRSEQFPNLGRLARFSLRCQL